MLETMFPLESTNIWRVDHFCQNRPTWGWMETRQGKTKSLSCFQTTNMSQVLFLHSFLKEEEEEEEVLWLQKASLTEVETAASCHSSHKLRFKIKALLRARILIKGRERQVQVREQCPAAGSPPLLLPEALEPTWIMKACYLGQHDRLRTCSWGAQSRIIYNMLECLQAESPSCLQLISMFHFLNTTF